MTGQTQTMARRRRVGLATILFTDIVGSSDLAREMGDRRWLALLESHHAIVRKALRRHGGRELDTAGDGFFAVFDGQESAIRCACEIAQGVRSVGLEVRAGLHVGETTEMAGKVGGVAVNTGARIAAAGGPGDVIVSSVLRELVPGGGFEFEDLGPRSLKGVPGETRLWRVRAVGGEALPGALNPGEASQRRASITISEHQRSRRAVAAVAGILASALVVVGILALSGGDEPGASTPSPRPPSSPVNALIRLDPTTGEMQRMTGGLLSRTDKNWISTLDVGEGGVWYVDEFLNHVDPSTGREEASHPETEGYNVAMTVGDREVWVVTPDELQRIDPADDDVLSRVRLRAPEASLGPTAIAVGEDTAWIAWDDGSVLPVGVDGKARKTIDAGELASDIIVAGDFVWVADPFSGEVVTINPRRNRVVGKIDVGGSPTALTSTEDHLWILDEAGVVVAVDLATRRQDVQVPVGEFPVDIDAGLGSVWVVNKDGTVRQISLTLMREEQTYDVGAPIGTLDVDEEGSVVWIRTIREGND